MSPERLETILKDHPVKKARYAYLTREMESLRRWLSVCKGEMVNDLVSMSQALTGMPHGTTPGDNVGRLATDIASGKVSVFVRQIEEDMDQCKREMDKIAPDIRTVDIVLSALGEREREIFTMRAIMDMSWAEILTRVNDNHNNSYSKRSLQRLYDRASQKAADVVK